ncbi:ABC transporter ATP-binding protein [Treponema sp.]|uniref:ABC transporter ATP-binding protein n=1 Tax=Treponema sp. TaxID=166 RepID=UPI0025FE25C1|nr:ABC transporter ATP-binding protein [Treponema sp.]MCR5217602.1 ABC transporter ATP-binding protein [Treponema sp.]
MNFFQAKDIYKQYPDTTIDVNFSAEEGSITTIVGPSGSGKSTVLRIIAGLEESDRPEEIILNNRIISGLPCSKRNCSMVFQNSALFMNMNVQQNIEYGLKSRKTDKISRRNICMEWLKRFNMEGFEKRKCNTLSGGEMQRVALIRSLVVKPTLLLLDEPLSALDAPLRKSLSSEIRALQKKEKLTIIMVTHDLEEARNISDRIILLKKGKITWSGKAKDFSPELF